MNKRVKFYGGHAHGMWMDVNLSQTQRVCVPKPDICVPRYGIQLKPFLQPLSVLTYWVDCYTEKSRCPHRCRTMWYGVPEGEKLLNQEACELERDLQGMSWEFPEFSILNDFDNWFASRWYARTGQLTWVGQLINDY